MSEKKTSRVVRHAVRDGADSASRSRAASVVPKILCVFAAFVLWIYVMQVESPEYEYVISSVPVELENARALQDESGLSVYSGSGNRINVTVAGKKSIVTKLTADDIKATVDLGRIKEAGRHSLDVIFELPDDVTIVSGEPSSITVYVDETDTVSLPISVKFKDASVIVKPYELGKPTTDIDTVTVTGPKLRLNELESAVVSIEMASQKATFTTSAEIVLVDERGNTVDLSYFGMSETMASVTVPIYLEKEYKVEELVKFKYGLVDAELVEITCEPETLTVKGDAAKLERDTLPFETIEIDETLIGSVPYTETRNITLGDGLTLMSDSTQITVSVDYDEKIRTREVTVTDIKVTGNNSDSKCEIQTDSLTVTLRGLAEELDRIKASDITATVELDGLDPASSGNISLPATVKIDAEDASGVFAVGTYPVRIKLTPSGEDTKK